MLTLNAPFIFYEVTLYARKSERSVVDARDRPFAEKLIHHAPKRGRLCRLLSFIADSQPPIKLLKARFKKSKLVGSMSNIGVW